jgi:hypothetical protein
MFPMTRVEWGYSPVMMDDREAEHCGVEQNEWVNRAPAAAMLSIAGVLTERWP